MSDSTPEVPPELEQLRDIVSYLEHSNSAVRQQALEIMQNFSIEESHIKALISFGVLKPTVALIADKSLDVSSAALNTLINFSAGDEDCVQAMLDAGAVNLLVEYLIQAVNLRSPLLALMLLVNLTRGEPGVRALMQDGKAYEGLHVTRLIRWFADPALRPLARAGADVVDAEAAAAEGDDWAYAGDVLANLSQLLSFRALVCDPKRALLATLRSQLSSANAQRRTAVMRILHNVSNDADKHALLLDPATGYWPVVVSLIISADPEGCIDEEDRAPMLPEVRAMYANPAKRADADGGVRTLVYETMLNLVRNAPSRAYLRATHTYHTLREAHKHERAVENERNDLLLEDDLVPFFILDDDAPAPGEKGDKAGAAETALALLRRQAKGLSLAEAEAELKAHREAEAAAALDPLMQQLGLGDIGASADKSGAEGESKPPRKHAAAVAEMDEDDEFAMAARYNEVMQAQEGRK